MGDKVAGRPPEGTPPADLSAFPPEVVAALLGPEPPNPSAWAVEGPRRPPSLALRPFNWPPNQRRSYLHREFARLLHERGGTSEAAVSIRRDLEDGSLRAVAIAADGSEYEIPPERWCGSDSALMYWTGRLDGAFIYLATALPPAKGKPDDLGKRERDTFLRLVLGMALAKYGFKPEKKDAAVKNIVADLEARGLKVSEQAVRDKLNDALEAVYDPADDKTKGGG